MKHWRTLADYLLAAVLSPSRERQAWTPSVEASARQTKGMRTDNPSGSANWAWLGAAAWCCHTGDADDLVRLARARLSGQGGTGWQDHELFSGYQAGVSASLAIGIHVARREGRHLPDIIEDVLRIDQLLLGLFSVHTRGSYRYNARVIAPALRVARGDEGHELVMLDRDYQAVACRHPPGSRPPAPKWGRHHRLGRQGAALSSWWLGRTDADRVGRYLYTPTADGARMIVERITWIAACHRGTVRLRPTREMFEELEAEIIQERCGDDALAYLTAWPGLGPTRPPWPGMAYRGHVATALHPYPKKWGFAGSGTAGLLTSTREGSQLVIEYRGAKRRRWFLPHSRRLVVEHPPGAWQVVLGPRGLEVEG